MKTPSASLPYHLPAADFAPVPIYIAGTKIITPWAEKMDAMQVLPEYPRPQLMRDNWMNLNGYWDYAIVPKDQGALPTAFSGSILVPFPVESALSGVGRPVSKEEVLVYQRTFTLHGHQRNQRVILHFGAVDWQCEVFVNGKLAGAHSGGFDPFSFDITTLANLEPCQQLTVRVWDPCDSGPQPRGKQNEQPGGIWYTAVTGIWQTVWLEAVPMTYISHISQKPDIDNQMVSVAATVLNAMPGDTLVVSAWSGNERICERTISAGDRAQLHIPNPELWSPANPFLYDLHLMLLRDGQLVDEVQSYFAMRKISMVTDANGIQRMMLNNGFVFQYGALDQGWWPDGLYTAPSDDALKFDIEKTLEMGFNMVRKHAKVEPARWYYHCDRLGMLVWQDMPSGDLGNHWENRPGIFGKATERSRTQESENIFRAEWKNIMAALEHFACVIVWVPFNEGWGQFKTREIVEWTMAEDTSRLVNTASGGNFSNAGHMIDLHEYPAPLMPDPQLFGPTKVLVLGEFGGLGLPLEHHTWQEKNNWGYQDFKDPEELFTRYSELMDQIPFLIDHGLSAAVYTQVTDVEAETNGLMTYDRRHIKIPAEKLRAVHAQLFRQNWQLRA